MGLNRSTFKHAAIYSLAAMLGKAIGFFMLPFYAHILRDIGYGVIGMIDASLTFLTSLLARGIQGALARFYHEEDGENKKLVISTGLWIITGATLVLVTIGALVSKPASAVLLGDSSYWLLFCMGLGAMFFDLLGKTAGIILVIQRRSIPFSAIGLLRLVIGVSLNIYLIIVLRMGLLGYFLSSLLTSIVPSLIFVVIAVRECGIKFDRRIARKIIDYQLPLIPSSLFSFASKQVERVLIRFLVGIQGVGVLEMGYKFPALLNLVITYPFFRSWDTKRIEIAERGGESAPVKIGQMFSYGLFLLVFVGLTMAVCIKDVIMILTPPEFWDAYRIARIEILGLIFFGASFHLNFGLFFAKKTKIWAFIVSATSVFKIGLSFIFIFLWGLYGAAFAATSVELIRFLWGSWRGQQYYRIEIEYRKVIGMSIVAGVIFVVLSRVDFAQSSAVKTLVSDHVPRWLAALDGTFLSTWKSGAVIRILGERADLILDLIAKFVLCLTFALFFPFVHEPARARVVRWLRFWQIRKAPEA